MNEARLAKLALALGLSLGLSWFGEGPLLQSAEAGVCEDLCVSDFISCSTHCVNQDCELCNQAYELCLAQCDISCTPTVATVTERTPNSLDYIGPIECIEVLDPEEYIWSHLTLLVTVKEVTTLADCNVTVKVLDRHFESEYCYWPWQPFCAQIWYPPGPKGPICSW